MKLCGGGYTTSHFAVSDCRYLPYPSSLNILSDSCSLSHEQKDNLHTAILSFVFSWLVVRYPKTCLEPPTISLIWRLRFDIIIFFSISFPMIIQGRPGVDWVLYVTSTSFWLAALSRYSQRMATYHYGQYALTTNGYIDHYGQYARTTDVYSP